MAIQQLKRDVGFGTLLGTGLGAGIGKSLESIAHQKVQAMQKKNMLSTLLGANVPENVASAIASAPKSLQREMFKPLLRLNKGLTQKRGTASIHNLRKQILRHVKKDPLKQNAVKEELSRLGMPPEEINVLLGTELNDEIVRYFLDKANNDPKKARKLAKKFGYKV